MKEVGLKAGANCSMSEVSFTIQHLFVGMVFLIVKVKALLLDAFKLVVLCAEHVNISYDSRVSKMVEGIVDDKTRGAARMKYGVVGIFDTWAMEVGGWVRACMERGTIDGFVFAFRPLIDDPIVD